MTIEEIKSKYNKEFSNIDVSELDKNNFYVFKVELANDACFEELNNVLRSLSGIIKNAGIKAIFIPVNYSSVKDVEIFEVRNNNLNGNP